MPPPSRALAVGGPDRGLGAEGGGVTMVLCKDKCESGCKIYRLPGLRVGSASFAASGRRHWRGGASH